MQETLIQIALALAFVGSSAFWGVLFRHERQGQGASPKRGFRRRSVARAYSKRRPHIAA